MRRASMQDAVIYDDLKMVMDLSDVQTAHINKQTVVYVVRPSLSRLLLVYPRCRFTTLHASLTARASM